MKQRCNIAAADRGFGQTAWMSRRAQKCHSLGRCPTKSMTGGTTRCPERVQPSKCFMAGEHGAQMAALDVNMAGEVSSVAARHCSLPLQCKCASSGEDHLETGWSGDWQHIAIGAAGPSGLYCTSREPHGIALKILVITVHLKGQSAHLLLMSQLSVTSITACASDSQDDDFLDIPRVFYLMHHTEHCMCIPHPTDPASLHPMHPRAIYRHPTRPTSPAIPFVPYTRT